MGLQGDPSLRPFFHPQGIVLIGASQQPTKLGYGIARNLVESRFPGGIYFVHPRGGTLFDRPVYADVSAVPDLVDLAVLLLPAGLVPEILAACGRRGIRAVIIAAGGFAETGPAGAQLEAECATIAREWGMRLLGPNCIGLLDTHLPVDTTFLPPPPPPAGDIAFISHSGAICAAIIDWARGQGFGLSRLVSLGNQVDVCETDVLPDVAADPHTRVVTMYLEGISDGRRFVETAAAVARQKPVLALKVGRSAAGRQAVASHTGALAGAETAVAAAFRRAGVLRVAHTETMFDFARALAWCPLPAGRQMAVLTNAGGPGVTAADALAAAGLSLASLQPETTTGLQETLPPAASLRNPVDMLAGASPEDYARCLQLLLADEEVHGVMVILPPPPMYSAGAVARALIPLILTADKPVVVVPMGAPLVGEAVAHLRAARVAEYRFPERAAAALGALAQYADFRRTEPDAPFHAADPLPLPDLHVLADTPSGEFLPPAVVETLLAAAGAPLPPAGLAQTAAEAVALAEDIGYPVALKISAAAIPHKSDCGGVLLGLSDQQAVRAGFTTVMENARRAFPDAQIDGVQVQHMIPEGQDVIVGVVRDAHFGPVVMFGSGGVEVEGLGDVAFALAPLTARDVDYLLAETWAGRRLRGYRHLRPADETAVRALLHGLGRLAMALPALVEIEINPLRVLAVGEGAFALDGRIRVG